MIISALGIRDFRNLQSVQINPHHRFNIISGSNGAGKTNLLEAVYVLGNVRSFRGSKNRELIRFDCDEATVASRVVRATHEQKIELAIDEKRKRFFIDGKGIQSFSKYLGSLSVVAFAPNDIELVRGSAALRRRFIDKVVCGIRPAQMTDLQDYDKVLRSRNFLLKEARPNTDLFSIYTEQLVEIGARLVSRRVETLFALAPKVEAVFSTIFESGRKLECQYTSKWCDEDWCSDSVWLKERIEAAFDRSRVRERQAGFTVVGPHRDDVKIMLDGLPVREYASQGQLRSAVLALKITEIEILQEHTGEQPVLLLDDVSSELDPKRNEQLFDFIKKLEGQTFITTTAQEFIRISDSYRHFYIDSGTVELRDEK